MFCFAQTRLAGCAYWGPEGILNMKKLIALFLMAFVASCFATRAMADTVVVTPHGVGIGLHHHGHDRHRGDEGMHHVNGHRDIDDHTHHADRDHDKDHPE